MEILPAIDLMNGSCVRLYQGRFDQVRSYDVTPERMARHFAEEGAKRLHIVDLDGAKEGRPVHLDLALRLSEASGLPIQLGGGLRGEQEIRSCLDQGVDRVLIGTLAIESPTILQRLGEEYGCDRIVVAVDVKDGRIASRGWEQLEDLTLEDALAGFRQRGFRRFLVTAVSRDGTLEGPDLELLSQCVATGARVLAAGGIGTLKDLRRLARLGAEAAVVGRALYEDQMTLKQALEVAGEATDAG